MTISLAMAKVIAIMLPGSAAAIALGLGYGSLDDSRMGNVQESARVISLRSVANDFASDRCIDIGDVPEPGLEYIPNPGTKPASSCLLSTTMSDSKGVKWFGYMAQKDGRWIVTTAYTKTEVNSMRSTLDKAKVKTRAQ